MPEPGDSGAVVPHSIGELVDVARTAPADGDTLVWDAAAHEWRPGAGGGGSGGAAYWHGAALGANKVELANVLASDLIVWVENQNVGDFTLSVDGKTLTLPAGGLFVAVLHISEYDNSDGVMVASLGGTGFAGGSNSAALTPLTGDDYGEGETTMLCHGAAAVTAQAGYGTVTPTKGSFTATLVVYKIA